MDKYCFGDQRYDYSPAVNGRDKVSQKWSFKSEPLWKSLGIGGSFRDLIPS
jgi:hypothetical protein